MTRPGSDDTAPHRLAHDLTAHTVEMIERFVAAHAADWRLPRTFAGHQVGADVRADLIFTLGHLAAVGVTTIAATPIDDAITILLGEVDGAGTHSFFSYRIAETLLEVGPFAGNPRLDGLDDRRRAAVAVACDSSSFLPLLDAGTLPRNYIAVLSRCESARLRLGLIEDRSQLDGLLERLRAVLASNPRHCLDDSNDGSGRYDIYTADIWLFCEPLAEAIGSEWRAGLHDAVTLVEQLVGPDGTAIPWGRSTGGLSIALTVELAAAAIAHSVGDDPGRWLRRGADAATAMRRWFGTDGVVNAHQHRDQDRYRGPARRLQLTFDLLGKLAWAARALQTASPGAASARAAAYPPVDRLVQFDDTTGARLWAYRSPALAFALPFVGAARSHYLPAPVRPGCFEVPVDQDLPCHTPLVIDGYRRFAAGGLPVAVTHEARSLTAHWDGFVSTTDTFATDRPDPLSGTRHARWTVDGRSLVLDDTLMFARVPEAVSFVVPEIATRPLLVDFTCPTPHARSTIDVDGIAEWRTSWSSLIRLHQLDLDPAATLTYSVRVTPKLRIASTAYGHHYDRSLYGPLAQRVVTRPSPLGAFADPSVDIGEVDAFHLHWPEWLAFDDVAEHERIADTLADHGIPVVWTAHNLTPHTKQPDRFDPVYAVWAQRANAVIHHSEWGRDRMLDRYSFAPEAEHVVLPHGHFGALWSDDLRRLDRRSAEARLGFAPCALRIGIVGAPRVEKRTAEFVAGFVASQRTDLQLAVWSLGIGESLPDDPRVVAAEQYRTVDAATYATRLAACDLLALPFDPDGEMLATGTVADAIGVGLPVLGSAWGFLAEYLGDARIDLGRAGATEVAAAIGALTPATVATARAATVARRRAFDWEPIAEATHALFDRVVERGV